MGRRKKSDNTFTGLTLEQWHGSPENIAWAQQDPRFKMMVSVLLNQSGRIPQTVGGCTEGRAFGRVEGYLMAIEDLRALGRRPEKTPTILQETFDEPTQHAFKDAEPTD